MPQVPLNVGEVSKVQGQSFPTNTRCTIRACSFHQHSRLLIAHSTPNSNCSFPSITETAHDVGSGKVQGRFREGSGKDQGSEKVQGSWKVQGNFREFDLLILHILALSIIEPNQG